MTLLTPHSTEYMAETPRAPKSAHHTTAIGIAAAIMNVPRVEQTVHVETTIFSGSPLGPRYVVFVKPKIGAGEIYECGQRALDQLRMVEALRSLLTLTKFELADNVKRQPWARAIEKAEAALAGKAKSIVDSAGNTGWIVP